MSALATAARRGRRARRTAPLAVVLAGAGMWIGCGSSTGGGGSACVSATSCPSDPPSYKADIVPILEEACTPCHRPGGIAGFPMTTYADVSEEAGSMLSQVTVCEMPPLDGPSMTDAQRTTLTAWLRCGAPDN